ncbi:hypothetical protein ABT214_23980, partial [Micromonospora purpureochromogenes]
PSGTHRDDPSPAPSWGIGLSQQVDHFTGIQSKAAPWVELALLVQWLIGSGHSAEQAEEWLTQFPAWTATDREVLNVFALMNASKWSAKSRQSTERWVHDLAMWTGEWAARRTDGHQSGP